MTEAIGMNEWPLAPDFIQVIVDRHIPPVPRRIVDCHINGAPIYADEVICPGG